MARIEQLEEVILPAAILFGAFGDDAELVSCDSHEGSHGRDQFASIVMFSSVEIKSKNKEKRLYLVVKFNQESEIFRKSVLTDIQLQNELFMYERFLPFLEIDENTIPKFYYGVATKGITPELDVLLMQDLRKDNYFIQTEGLHLDYDHIVIALHQLAKLHACSFRAKNKCREAFYENTEHLCEAQWVSGKLVSINSLLKPVAEKVLKKLIISQERIKKILEQFLSKVSDPLSYAEELIKPSEPLSVVCHGDFCKDNILYSYNENGRVIRAKILDFGTARYSSPIVDLSFFLFLNTTSSVRRKHMDDFLTEYYNVLKSMTDDNELPNIETFEEEFRAKAVYGFLECCLKIPIALSDPIDWEELTLLTEEQVEDLSKTKCNENVTKLLSEILQDLIYFECKPQKCE